MRLTSESVVFKILLTECQSYIIRLHELTKIIFAFCDFHKSESSVFINRKEKPTANAKQSYSLSFLYSLY